MRTRQWLAFVAVLIAAGGSLAAHHAWPATYDDLKIIQGTFVSISWTNPHVTIRFDVRRPNESVEHWTGGGPNILRMRENGWTPTTLKPGDTMTGEGYQLADGQNSMMLERIVMANGKEMRVFALPRD